MEKNRTDGFSKKPLKNLFQESPPLEAVAFAMRSLGTCFGDAPDLPTLEELNLVSGNFDMQACKSLASATSYRLNTLPPEMASHAGWGNALSQYMTKPSDKTFVGKSCGVVPKAGLSYIDSVIQRRKDDKIAHENRTVEQRIRGLDAFDITYSLVSRTLSGEHQPTRELPAGAIEWNIDYVAKVENGDPQPSIPEAVQQWAVEQPLDKFNAVEDPFTARKRLKSYEITQSHWARHVRSRLNKVAPNEERITVSEGCSILWGIAWGDVKFGDRSPATVGESEYYRLLVQTPDKWSRAMCDETPIGVFYHAKALYKKRLEKEAYARANPPQPTVWDELAESVRESARQSSVRAPYGNTPII